MGRFAAFASERPRFESWTTNMPYPLESIPEQLRPGKLIYVTRQPTWFFVTVGEVVGPIKGTGWAIITTDHNLGLVHAWEEEEVKRVINGRDYSGWVVKVIWITTAEDADRVMAAAGFRTTTVWPSGNKGYELADQATDEAFIEITDEMREIARKLGFTIEEYIRWREGLKDDQG